MAVRPTAIFSTLTYPLYLAEVAQERGLDARALGLRKLIVAGEPGGQLDATRRRLEELWGASLRDTYGLSDVWATFAAECEEHAGLHFAGQDGLHIAAVDLAALGDTVKWEPSRGGALFPHVYAALPLSAVIAYGPLERGNDGKAKLPVAG